MGVFDSLKSTLQGHFNKKKEDKEFEDRLRLDASVQKRLIYEEQFKKDALEVAKAQAYKESAEATGLSKLRATNRSRRLRDNDVAPGSTFEKLREFTQRNKARTEANMKRTEEMRSTALKMRQDKAKEMGALRTDRMNKVQTRPGFGTRPYIR